MKYPQPVQHLFDAFERAGRDLYLVGGAVRDFELGHPFDTLDDLDFCTDARPPETARILREAKITVYELGAEFGTVGAVLYAPDELKEAQKSPKTSKNGQKQPRRAQGAEKPAPAQATPLARYPKDCQITTYRSEEYYRRGSRHPVVKFGDTIAQDLGRRDFSINSMALDARGELVDPYGGRRDLKSGILRVVGDPLETLAEDPLRILRIGRFISKLGFQPTETLREAAAQRAPGILEISAERWLQEMGKLLRGRHVGRALGFLREIGLLTLILPEVDALWEFQPDQTPKNQKKHDAWHHAKPASEPSQAGFDDEIPGFLWSQTIRALERAPRVDEAADTRLGWALLLQYIGAPMAQKDPAQAQGSGADIEAAWRALGARAARQIARRFRFDNDSTREVGFLVREYESGLAERAGDWSDPKVRRWVRRMRGHERAMLNFQRANIAARCEEGAALQHALGSIDALQARIDQLHAQNALHPELPSGLGNILMRELDLRPSPTIGALKDWLDEEIIDERIESARDSYYYVDYVRRFAPQSIFENTRPDKPSG